ASAGEGDRRGAAPRNLELLARRRWGARAGWSGWATWAARRRRTGSDRAGHVSRRAQGRRQGAVAAAARRGRSAARHHDARGGGGGEEGKAQGRGKEGTPGGSTEHAGGMTEKHAVAVRERMTPLPSEGGGRGGGGGGVCGGERHPLNPVPSPPRTGERGGRNS